MRKTASSVIRDLEIRVARLERLSRVVEPDEMSNHLDRARQLSKVDPTLSKAIVMSGDGNQDKIQVSKASWPATVLKPSQTTMVLEKSIGMALTMLNGKMDTDLGAIVSSDRFIMDGHHRWSAAVIAFGKDATVGGYKADLKGAMLLRVLNILSKGFFLVRNGKKGKGSLRNYTPDNVRLVLEEFTTNGIGGDYPVSPEKVQQILTDNFGGVDEGIEQMSNNVRHLSKDVAPFAPKRQDMPVIEPSDVPTAAKMLNRGDVLWNPPYPEIEV